MTIQKLKNITRASIVILVIILKVSIVTAQTFKSNVTYINMPGTYTAESIRIIEKAKVVINGKAISIAKLEASDTWLLKGLGEKYMVKYSFDLFGNDVWLMAGEKDSVRIAYSVVDYHLDENNLVFEFHSSQLEETYISVNYGTNCAPEFVLFEMQDYLKPKSLTLVASSLMTAESKDFCAVGGWHMTKTGDAPVSVQLAFVYSAIMLGKCSDISLVNGK